MLDVGANTGCFALLAAADPELHVLALEPAAGNFAALEANVALNGLGARVFPLRAAAWNATAVPPPPLLPLPMSLLYRGGEAHQACLAPRAAPPRAPPPPARRGRGRGRRGRRGLTVDRLTDSLSDGRGARDGRSSSCAGWPRSGSPASRGCSRSKADPPPPPLRTSWTRLVPPPVLIGQVSAPAAQTAPRRPTARRRLPTPAASSSASRQ
jgi:hypothetical protein